MIDVSERGPSQLRSRITHDRLCDAAEDLLRAGGLAACTIADVARASERSVGSVYRRFGGKDEMIEAVIDRYLSRAVAANSANIERARIACPTLSDRIAALVDGMVAGRVRDGRLVDAFREAARASTGGRIQVAFEKTRQATLLLAQAILLDRSEEIQLPHVSEAVQFTIEVLVATVEYKIQQFDIPDDHAILRDELKRMMRLYLVTPL